jgi:predicted TPR repeat methyltransferase
MNKKILNTPQFVGKLKEVELLIAQSELEKAVLALNQLVKSSPRDPRLYLLGSRLAHASGNPEGVLQAAAKAHRFAPQWPVATLHFASVMAQRGEGEPAMAFAGMAVDQASKQSTLTLELLHTVAGLAHGLKLPAQALVWLRLALQMDPKHTSTRYKVALALTTSGDFGGAIEVLTALLNDDSTNAALLSARMQAYLGAGMMDRALVDGAALLALAPANEEYLFYQTVARRETPATQPASLISRLFDESADRFDQINVVGLKYKLPRDVAQQILAWHPERKVDVLDLGCGTGLLGVCLGALDGAMVGVDLSAAMIEQASRHGVYDKFHQVNVLNALQATPEGLYDVIAALDVFPFIGALEAAIPDAYRILQVGGHFVFSCESEAAVDAKPTTARGYSLLPSYRFSHQRAYVQDLVNKAGFENVVLEDVVLRQETTGPVHGFLVTAQKPQKSVQRLPKSAKPARRT